MLKIAIEKSIDIFGPPNLSCEKILLKVLCGRLGIIKELWGCTLFV